MNLIQTCLILFSPSLVGCNNQVTRLCMYDAGALAFIISCCFIYVLFQLHLLQSDVEGSPLDPVSLLPLHSTVILI